MKGVAMVQEFQYISRDVGGEGVGNEGHIEGNVK